MKTSISKLQGNDKIGKILKKMSVIFKNFGKSTRNI